MVEDDMKVIVLVHLILIFYVFLIQELNNLLNCAWI